MDEDSTRDVPLVVLSRLAAAGCFRARTRLENSMRWDARLWFTVAGVADDAKNGGLTSDEQPEIYYLRGTWPVTGRIGGRCW